MGRVVAGEPNLVDAVVEGNDAIVRHHLADVGHQPLRIDGKRDVVDALVLMMLAVRRGLCRNRRNPNAVAGSVICLLICQMLLAMSPTTSTCGK